MRGSMKNTQNRKEDPAVSEKRVASALGVFQRLRDSDGPGEEKCLE
jgi:hypothetical protein